MANARNRFFASAPLVSLSLLFVLASCATRDAKTDGARTATGTPGPAPKPSPTPTPTPKPTLTTSAMGADVAIDDTPARPREHFTLRDDLDRPIEVYPPLSQAPRAPLVVVLHATCMQPASVCDWFGAAGRDSGWLVCPSGNSTCYGEPDWYGNGTTKGAFLERAISKVQDTIPTFVDDRRGVLFGWSRGAYAARDIVYAAASGKDPKLAELGQRFRGLVLVAAQVTPDVEKLRAFGITRVVMAAGDLDMSTPTMTAAVKTLKKKGMEARWISLGKIGHVWPEDFDVRMREPIAWAAGNEDQGDMGSPKPQP
jgi:predicted esterase